MPYAKATFEVIFEHEDSVPAELTALRVLMNATTDSVIAGRPVSLEPLTEAEVITGVGGCGECEHCQQAQALLVTGDSLDKLGEASGDAIVSEEDAIARAHQHTI